ncbi:leucine-rich repeat-containing protein 15-like [Chironomus tepperi]|uniref:leucine-rich repeat-containing protein 15-like n=1 Tax=Chironomus tepperi TaxID=113505 RepID=UPI00391FB1DA
MKVNNLILVLAIIFNIDSIYGQNVVLRCVYSTNLLNGYRCDLTIINPNGLNNFTVINGTHLFLRTDSHVRYITSSSESYTMNIPSIICEKFSNTTTIELLGMGVQKIDEDSFKNCKDLSYLDLKDNNIKTIDENSFKQNFVLNYLLLWFNKITEIPDNSLASQHNLLVLDFESNQISNLTENVFKSLISLRFLYLENNLIEELPKNIFTGLSNVLTIRMDNNSLKIIHADSFGILPTLNTVNLASNQIEAIDERFIDNTGITTLNLINNECANSNIVDITLSRLLMRTMLSQCFRNYEDIKLASTTTTITTTVTTTTTSLLPSTASSTTESSTAQTTTESSTPQTTSSTATTTTSTLSPIITESTTIDTNLPPECVTGNLDERVCNLEDENQATKSKIDVLTEENKKLHSKINYLTSKFEEKIENLENKIEAVSKDKWEIEEELRNQNKILIAAVRELENQFFEIKGCSCGCR